MKAFDLHTHLLPGVDDGPSSLVETIELLRHCFEDGTRAAVMTPHMFSPYCGSDSVDEMRRVFDRTLEELRRLSSQQPEYRFLAEMEFYLGAENYVSAEFLEALARRAVLPLGTGRSLLVEFGPYTGFETMLAAVKRILDAGFTPIVAHVERYAPFRSHRERIWELVEQGAVAQVNADRVVESKFRRSISESSLLHEKIDVVVASDVHDLVRRRSRLSEAHQILAERFSSGLADRWIWNRSRALVIGS